LRSCLFLSIVLFCVPVAIARCSIGKPRVEGKQSTPRIPPAANSRSCLTQNVHSPTPETSVMLSLERKMGR
jgi:hypothetical protein